MTRRMHIAVRVWPWLLALLVLFPVLAPGYVLSYDMVFVPDLAMRSDFLGFGSSLPRAVPSDTLVALLDEVLPGMWLQKVILVAALVLAGLGARRLVPEGNGVAQLAATSLYVWNPYVAERLWIGHWPVLLAYAALPWIIDSARRLRRGDARLGQLTLWLALSATSASGGVMGAVAALAFVGGRPKGERRQLLLVGLLSLAVNLPWIVSGLLHAGAARTDPDGAPAFASVAEGALPLPITLLGLGGIWNTEVVPATRLTWAAPVSLIVLALVAALGLRPWLAWLPRRDAVAMSLLGAGAMLVGGAAAVGSEAFATVIATIPGAGLFRDGSRYLALLAPLEASLFGVGAAALTQLVRDRRTGVVLAGGAILAPLALMPDFAAGLAGQLRPVSYPGSYAEARSALAHVAEDEDGSVLILPFTSYRLPEWNGGRRTFDPLGRFLTPNYLASDDLYVSGTEVSGEDPRAALVQDLLERAESSAELTSGLREAGVRWVALDHEADRMLTAEAAPVDLLQGVPVVYDDPGITVWELQAEVVTPPVNALHGISLASAWMAATTVVAGGVLFTLRNRRRRTSRRFHASPTRW